MTIRYVAVGLAILAGLGLWSRCRSCAGQARAEPPEAVHTADELGVGRGGTRDEALARYRLNQPRHWRQLALGGGGR